MSGLVVPGPKPHSEIVNPQPSVLIIGYGHVGRQIARYFTEADYVDADGIVRDVAGRFPPGRRPGGYDLGFICVPTPENPDGSCDTSAVRQVYQEWRPLVKLFCIKSTVPVGFTAGLSWQPTVCFSPEYYGETVAHPMRDSLPFVILGGPRSVTRRFAEAWSLVTNSTLRIYQTDARTAELAKLMENSWIATKVAFVNQFYDLAELANVDWFALRELFLADPRVSPYHTYVYPDNRGFGGKCLPKDTASLCDWARTEGQPAELIEAVRAYNTRLRSGVRT